MALGPTDIEELDSETTAALFGEVRDTEWYPHLARHVRQRADEVPTDRLQGFERPNGRRIVVVSEGVGERALPGASMTFTFEGETIVDARAETHPDQQIVEWVTPTEFTPDKADMDPDEHGIPGAELASVHRSEHLTVFELEVPDIPG